MECLHIEPRAECRSLVAVGSKYTGSSGLIEEKEGGDGRDCGQEVLDGEIGNNNVVLCHDGCYAIFGDSFHDETRSEKERERNGRKGGKVHKARKKKWGEF